MRKVLAITCVLLLAVVLVVIAGCGAKKEEPATQPRETQTQQEAPKEDNGNVKHGLTEQERKLIWFEMLEEQKKTGFDDYQKQEEALVRFCEKQGITQEVLNGIIVEASEKAWTTQERPNP